MGEIFGVKFSNPPDRSHATCLMNHVSCQLNFYNKDSEIYISKNNHLLLAGKEKSLDKNSLLFFAGNLFESSSNKPLNLLNSKIFASQIEPSSCTNPLPLTNGQFSLAHYNFQNNKLLLAIDQFGIKSLYYAKFDNGIVFSSRLSILLASKLIRPKLSLDMFALYTTVRMDAVSDSTWFNGVFQVEPGSLIAIDVDNEITSKQYWLPPNNEKSYSMEQILDTFIHAVNIRKSAKHGAVLLSGGVDSCAVAAALYKMDIPLKTCMFTFEELPENKNIDLKYAKKFLDYFNKSGEVITISPKNLPSLIKEIVLTLHRPIVHGCEFGMYFMYGKLQEMGCKNAYTGQGADIMWGEQDSQYFPILSPNFKVDMHSEHYLKNHLYQNDTKPWYNFIYSHIYKLFNIDPCHVNNLIWKKIFKPYRLYATDDLFKKARLHELYRNVAYINHMNSCFSSKFGIIEIPSFQDIHLANIAFSFPEYIKNQPNDTYSLKPVLKKAFEPLLPGFILKRKKMGFPAPNFELWKKELVKNLDSNLPFNIKMGRENLEKLSFTELVFLFSTKIWLDEFNLC